MHGRPRSRAALLAAVLLGLTVSAGLSGCTTSDGSGTAASTGTGIAYTGAGGTIRVLDRTQREQPIALAGTTLEGERFDLASLRGSVAVLNVWGSWCPPCHKEAPDLQRASLDLAPRGVRFVGIAKEDTADPSAAIAFQRSYEITFPSLMDPDGKALLALRGTVSPNAVPSTLVIDPEGRVAARISGPVNRAMLVAVVTSVLDNVSLVLDLAATPTPSTVGATATPSPTGPAGTP